MKFEEKIKKHRELEAEKATLTTDKKRIDGFLARDSQNRDTAAAMKGNLIFVKFAGTGCYMPKEIFEEHLKTRQKEIDERLGAVDTEIKDIEK